MIDNGYIGLLFGAKWENDRIHLNDAEFIRKNDRFVQEGDIMLSSRHLSTVFLYRPSTNKIVWLKTGPFLNQHDIDYLGNGEFLIYGNDNVNFGNARLVKDYSSLYVYDMKNDTVSRKLGLENANVNNNSQGRSQLLDNGHFFIDDSKRVLILDSKGSIVFSYTHPINSERIGSLHWARFYHELPTTYLER